MALAIMFSDLGVAKRPISISELRPVAEMCQQEHWAQRMPCSTFLQIVSGFPGFQIKVRRELKDFQKHDRHIAKLTTPLKRRRRRNCERALSSSRTWRCNWNEQRTVLWMHNLKNMSYHLEFVPEGCTSSQPAVTFGAGVQWAEVFEFADANNITVIGAIDLSVGCRGGGYSVLSNTLGLGVDRVFKVVTPDRELRVANACQNQDLFFALRGGGGGTFYVVLEATLLASPPVMLQAVIISWSNPNRTLRAEMWNIMVDNGLKWAADGWGGFSLAETAILVNPALDPAQAAISMAPLIDFGHRLQEAGVPGAQTVVTTFSSFLPFFNAFTLEHPGMSHLPTDCWSTHSPSVPAHIQDELPNSRKSNLSCSGLQASDDAAPGVLILLVPPVSYKAQGSTSVTDAWRSSLYHVTAISSWAWNATTSEKQAVYQSASNATEKLRKIIPDAAYLNEADVYEPNHEVTFWGSHYQELLRIKLKYDSRQLLDQCWQCFPRLDPFDQMSIQVFVLSVKSLRVIGIHTRSAAASLWR
ncbi:Cytokinin dehydrogenase 11 [Mycena venus]|uniref:Cytokinin dehydrogenase 11 n=1 Tax=Mycena venus TaxID=2733690 RepID=A0A8H6X3W2_9AGAR|nr:Cytokinin dehydrogenase 11 [Mycena venus]